jgi:hypothetical protein
MVALAFGVKKLLDVRDELQFLHDAEKNPPGTWAEFEAAIQAQATKLGIQVPRHG